MSRTRAVVFLLIASAAANHIAASEITPYSPYVGRDFPMNVYWGDTHLHTSLSFDAYGDGNTTKGPDYAYRFARGEQVEGHDGLPVRISRPLDFLVIADHGEYMGVVQGVARTDKELLATADGKRWSEMASKGEDGLLEVGFYPVSTDGLIKGFFPASSRSILRLRLGLWNRSM